MATADNASTGRPASSSALTLSVEAPGTTLVTQQSAPVITWVRNDGTQPQLVPAAGGPSPYLFRLTQQSGKPSLAGAVEVSEQTRAEALHDGTPAPVVPDAPFNLGAGLRSRRSDDVVALLNRPLGPGVYEVLPVWRRDDGSTLQPAAAARFEVVAPRPASLSTAICGTDQRRLLAFTQPQAAGGHTLLLQESFPGGKGLALFHPVMSATGAPGSVAVSIKPTEAPGGRWVAWLHDGTLSARRVPSLRIPPAAPQLVLDGAAEQRLLSPGFTLADGSALFVAVQRRGELGLGIRLLQVSEGGARQLGETQRWHARSPEYTVLRHINQGRGASAFELVWGEDQDVMSQAFTLQSGDTGVAAGAAVRLGSTDTRIIGLHAAALGAKSNAPIHVACGEPGQGLQVVQLRTPNPLPATPRRAPVLSLPPTVASTQALAITALREGPALALAFPDRISYALPGDTQWRTHECRSDAAFVRLSSLDGSKLWLEWLDPSHGFRTKRV